MLTPLTTEVAGAGAILAKAPESFVSSIMQYNNRLHTTLYISSSLY